MLLDELRAALHATLRGVLFVAWVLGTGLFVALWLGAADDPSQATLHRVLFTAGYLVFLGWLAEQGWRASRRTQRLALPKVSVEASFDVACLDEATLRHAASLHATGLPWEAVCEILEPRWRGWPEEMRRQYREEVEKGARKA
ncbi:MAG: hypothetical protein ACOZNI_22960 [Myxococcota bacterium]